MDYSVSANGLNVTRHTQIASLRYINSQLDSEAKRTQTKEIELSCLFISVVCVLWNSISS